MISSSFGILESQIIALFSYRRHTGGMALVTYNVSLKHYSLDLSNDWPIYSITVVTKKCSKSDKLAVIDCSL